MATLNVDNFPDDLYARLRARAERENRSVEQQITHLLGKALPEKTRSLMELEGLGSHWWHDVDSTTYLEEERNSWD